LFQNIVFPSRNSFRRASSGARIFGDDVATVLKRTAYHLVAEGYGGKGFILDKEEDIERVFEEARQAARAGQPVLINALIGKTDFRKGSISM